MARPKPKFSTYDVQRALRGVQNAGLGIARCEIRTDGSISVVTTDGAALDASTPESDESLLNPLERWRKKRDARKSTEPQA
jgi:hypothetical protein